MHKLFLFTSILLLPFLVKSQEKGVDFRELTYTEALATAASENKLIFLECYAHWCNPSKRMNDAVFKLPEAGAFFNNDFICVKYNTEAEGYTELKKLFNLHAYPTFLLINAEGNILHRMVGACELNTLLEKLGRGLNQKTSLAYLSACYEEGKLGKENWLDYWHALNDARSSEVMNRVRKSWLEQLSEEEKCSSLFWPLFQQAGWGSEEFDYIGEHLDQFRSNCGEETINAFLAKELGGVIRKNYRELNKTITGSIDTICDDLIRVDHFIAGRNLKLTPDLESKLSLIQAYSRNDWEYIVLYLEEQAGAGKTGMDILAALNLLQLNGEGNYPERIKRISNQLIQIAPRPYKEQLTAFLQKQGCI